MDAGQIVPAGSASIDAPAQPVLRRQVFYVSGFDPLGPRRYRELYRTEAPRQGKLAGYEATVAGQPAGPDGAYRWDAVLTEADGRSARASFEFLGWDDIVRHSIRPSLLHVYRIMFRTLALYLGSGALGAMLRLRRGPLIAGLYPVAVMLFYLVFAGLAGVAGGAFASALGAPAWLAVPAGMVAFVGVMLGTRYTEEQILAYFLVNDLAWSAQDRGAWPPELDARLDRFAERIAETLASDEADEVLVVGHSSGAQLAVTALRRALERHGAQPRSELALLTLGQSIPMTSFLPGAEALRADLAALADDARVFWLDVSAPTDGACFALTDPVAVTRAAGRPEGTQNPVILSAAFRNTIDPARLRRMRWRLFRLHFQYLCAFDRPGSYDYFRITAGPETLRERHGGTGISPSAITVPAGPYLHAG